MTDTNYTPDEVRLLDEFAKAALSMLPGQYDLTENVIAEHAYDLAMDMIAERRKRVPQGAVLLKPCPNNSPLCVPSEDNLTHAARIAREVASWPAWKRGALGENPLSTKTASTADAPVAQPQPEPDRGELTEEAVKAWDDDVRRYLLDKEADRAVALMREGLRAKRERDELLRLGRMTRQDGAECADSLMESADEIAALRARAEKAEAALAEVQPVLDAVVDHFKFHGTKWDRDPFKTLQAYADRRREQAKGAS